MQIPVLALSTILVIAKVNIKLPPEIENRSTYEKLRRIDVLGSTTLVATVGTLLLGFSLKSTEELPWSHPLIWGLFVASAIFAVAFVYVETHIAPFPVMPMHLITRRTPLFVSLSNLYVFSASPSTELHLKTMAFKLWECSCFFCGTYHPDFKPISTYVRFPLDI